MEKGTHLRSGGGVSAGSDVCRRGGMTKEQRRVPDKNEPTCRMRRRENVLRSTTGSRAVEEVGSLINRDAPIDATQCSVRDIFLSVIPETSDDHLVGQQRSPSLAPVMGGIKYYARLGIVPVNLELPSRRPVSDSPSSSTLPHVVNERNHCGRRRRRPSTDILY